MEKLNFINVRQRHIVEPRGKTLVVDKEVSRAVGKTIFTNNPKLIRKVAEWKKKENRGDEGLTPNPRMDNFLDDPKKVEELKKIL